MIKLIKIIIIWAAILLPFSYPAMAADGKLLSARGMIVAVHQPVISSEIAARIKTLPFREGDHFKRNSLLVAFEDGLLKAQQNKTLAELEAARLKLDNSRELEKLQSIGSLEVSLAAVDLKSCLAQKTITDISLERCKIKAPFNGRVIDLFVNEHEIVGPQQKLMEIVSTDELEIKIMAPAEWLNWLQTGLKFTVRLDTIDFKTKAKVIAIGAVVDPVSKMIQIRGTLDTRSKNLLPGMSASVYFGE